MASQVQIANRALSRLGSARILSLDQGTVAANAVADAWDLIRDEVLRGHSWNSIAKRAQLAELGSTPSFGYAHQYQTPSDCLRVIEVLSGDGETPTTYSWVVERGIILTDEGAPLRIRYVRRETDPQKFDPMLASVIASRLAVELCEELTQSNSKKQLLLAEHRQLWDMATKADGEEQSVMPFVEDTWITSRF